MIRWPNHKEAVAWLRANAQGPAGFYLWGTIYVQRALWDGSSGDGSAMKNSRGGPMRAALLSRDALLYFRRQQ